MFLVSVSGPAVAAAGPPNRAPRRPDSHTVKTYRLDQELQKRADRPSGTSRVILELKPGYDVPDEVQRGQRLSGTRP